VLATALEMLRLGLVAGSSGNVSARDGELVHITPSGLPYEEMTAGDLVTLALDGTVVSGERAPSSERLVHLGVYEARADAAAVVHTHSVHATAWSFLEEPLDLGTEELEHAAGGAVLTAPFAPSGSEQLVGATVNALAGRRATLLARHGVLAIAQTPAAAVAVAAVVERQAQIAWLLRGA
jgi:L-fuculose-phosphate aldolase